MLLPSLALSIAVCFIRYQNKYGQSLTQAAGITTIAAPAPNTTATYVFVLIATDTMGEEEKEEEVMITYSWFHR